MPTLDNQISVAEKLNKLLPPLLREAFALLIATGIYGATIPFSAWNFTIVGILLATTCSLLASYFADRRPRFTFHFHWKDFQEVTAVYKKIGERFFDGNPPGYKYTQLEKMGRQELHLELSDICSPHSFISFAQKTKHLVPGGWQWEEEPAAIIVTDLPPEALHSRWLHNFFFRVGYCNVAGEGRLEWFTFCPKRLLDRKKPPASFVQLRQLRKELASRPLGVLHT